MKRPAKIRGVQIPTPVGKPLEKGTQYYKPSITTVVLISGCIWKGDYWDTLWLHRGLVHLTPDNARRHALALIAATDGLH